MTVSAPLDLITVGSLFVELTPSTPGEALTMAHQYTLVAGGAAANVVFALARLGVRVGFITAVGDDDFGTLTLNELIAFGVDTSLVRRVEGQSTPVTFAAIDGQGGKRFAFYRFAGYCNPLGLLEAADFQQAGHCRLFDFNEGSIRDPALRPLVFQAVRNARNAGCAVLYAVNLRQNSWREENDGIRRIEQQAIQLADIVILNEDEMRYLYGDDCRSAVRCLQASGAHVVVITRGGDGDISLHVGDDTAAIPPYHVPVIYDIGAGDTFHAGLAAAALRRQPLTMSLSDWIDAVRFAAATAAFRVSSSANPHDLPTFIQVQEWMKRRVKGEG